MNEDVFLYLPLLLNPDRGDEGVDDFVLPVDNEGLLAFKKNEKFELNCLGGYIKINDVATTESKATATCLSGIKFRVLSKTIPFRNITCTKFPKHEARYSGKKCLGDFKEVEIGFPLEDAFLTQIKICFDPYQQNSLYSQYKMSYSINGYQVKFSSSRFP